MTRFAHTLTRPLIFLPALALAVAATGMAAFMMLPAPGEVAVIATPAGALLVGRAASLRDRQCESCGTMETITRTDPATGLPTYAFSVRMRDGSTRDSTGATRGRWLEGDRVMLIGGTAARALEEKNASL